MEYFVIGLALISALGVGVFIGIFIGIFIGVDRMRKAVEEGSVGDLRIDRSEPDEPPRPCLEIYRGNSIESIAQKKFVILKINNESYLSRD